MKINQMKIKKDIDRSTFGGRIYTLREENKLTIEQLARRVFVNEAIICLWEQGKNLPSFDTIISICKNMNVSADWLLGLSDKRR